MWSVLPRTAHDSDTRDADTHDAPLPSPRMLYAFIVDGGAPGREEQWYLNGGTMSDMIFYPICTVGNCDTLCIRRISASK